MLSAALYFIFSLYQTGTLYVHHHLIRDVLARGQVLGFIETLGTDNTCSPRQILPKLMLLLVSELDQWIDPLNSAHYLLHMDFTVSLL